MQTRTLGPATLEVSALGYGTMASPAPTTLPLWTRDVEHNGVLAGLSKTATIGGSRADDGSSVNLPLEFA